MSYIIDLIDKYDNTPIYKCFLQLDDKTGEKIIPLMPSYEYDDELLEWKEPVDIPATFGYIDMKDNYEYWNNVLEWNFVIKRPDLLNYIQYRLGIITDDESNKEWKERLKIYKKIHSPKSYKLIKSRKE